MLHSELEIENYIKIYTSDIIRKEKMDEEEIRVFMDDVINAMAETSERPEQIN